MTTKQEKLLASRMERAIAELQGLITRRFPDATFEVEQSPEDRRITHLVATVDVDDRYDVMDLVIDRMMDIQINEKLPLFVVVLRTPEREAQVREALRSEPHLAADVPVGIAGT